MRIVAGMFIEEAQVFQRLINKHFRIKEKCKIKNCNNTSAANHVLSKCFLNNICNKNKEIYYFDSNFFRGPSYDNTLNFNVSTVEKIKNTPLSIRSYCSKHDSEFFKCIEPENGFINWDDNHVYKMLAYRSILHEWNVRKNFANCYEEILVNPSYHSIYERRNLAYVHAEFQESLQILEQMLNNVLNDRCNPELETTKFIRFSKKYEFYFIGFNILKFFEDPNYSKMNTAISCNPFTRDYIFFNFIPQKDASVFSLATFDCGNNFVNGAIHRFLKTMESLNEGISFPTDEHRYLKYISDIAISGSQVWAFSENFYKEFIQDRESQILELKKSFGPDENGNSFTRPIGDFCLFWR